MRALGRPLGGGCAIHVKRDLVLAGERAKRIASLCGGGVMIWRIQITVVSSIGVERFNTLGSDAVGASVGNKREAAPRSCSARRRGRGLKEIDESIVHRQSTGWHTDGEGEANRYVQLNRSRCGGRDT